MSKGQQIKTLRTALNLSRRQLAELTGLTTQTVVNIEAYNINKNSDVLLKYLLNFKDEAIAKCLYDYMKKAREKVGNNSTYVDVTVSNNCHNSGRVRKGGI